MRFFWDSDRPESEFGLWLEDYFICHNILTISFLAGATISPAAAIMIVIGFVLISRYTNLRNNEAFRLAINVLSMFAALSLASILIGRLSEGKREFFLIYNLMVIPLCLLMLLVPFAHLIRIRRINLAKKIRLMVRGIAALTTVSTALFYLAAAGSVSQAAAVLYSVGLFASMLAVTFFNSEVLSLVMLVLGCIAALYLSFYSGQIPSGPFILLLAAIAAVIMTKGRAKAQSY
jgi:hypothetical protein